jgi:hypothetical protein
VRIRESERPVRTQLERGPRGEERALTVYRPELPQPDRPTRLVGAGVRPATREIARRNTSASELNFAPNRDLSIENRPNGRDPVGATPRISRSAPVTPQATSDPANRAPSVSDPQAGPRVGARPTGRSLQERQGDRIPRTDPDQNSATRRELSRTPTVPSQATPRAVPSTPGVVAREAAPRSIQQRQPAQSPTPGTPSTSPVRAPQQRVFRQEPIRVQPQVLPQTPTPIQRQAIPQIQRQPMPEIQRPAPVIQQPRIEQRQQPMRINPPVQRSEPVMRSQPMPRIESAPVQRSMPRMEAPRPAPSAPVMRQSPPPSSGGMSGPAVRSAPQRMEGGRTAPSRGR